MLVLEWKEIAFIEKVNSGCLCWFPMAILVHQSGTPIWRLHTKLYKVAWNILANTSYSETVGHKDLRLGQIVYIHALVFYNISFSWLLPLDGSQFILFANFRSLNLFQTFDTFFRLLSVPDPCTALKKHSKLFLVSFFFTKKLGWIVYFVGGGGAEMLLDLSRFP